MNESRKNWSKKLYLQLVLTLYLLQFNHDFLPSHFIIIMSKVLGVKKSVFLRKHWKIGKHSRRITSILLSRFLYGSTQQKPLLFFIIIIQKIKISLKRNISRKLFFMEQNDPRRILLCTLNIFWVQFIFLIAYKDT